MYGLPEQEQMMCALATVKEMDGCSGLDKRLSQDSQNLSFIGNIGSFVKVVLCSFFPFSSTEPYEMFVIFT